MKPRISVRERPIGWRLNQRLDRWEYWFGGELKAWVSKMPDNEFLGFVGWSPQ